MLSVEVESRTWEADDTLGLGATWHARSANEDDMRSLNQSSAKSTFAPSVLGLFSLRLGSLEAKTP